MHQSMKYLSSICKCYECSPTSEPNIIAVDILKIKVYSQCEILGVGFSMLYLIHSKYRMSNYDPPLKKKTKPKDDTTN